MEEAGHPYDEAEERESNYRKWSSKHPELRIHMLTRSLGRILQRLFPGETILSRLQEGWPAGNKNDFLIPSHKLAFAYRPPRIEDADSTGLSFREQQESEAEQWCNAEGYRLILLREPGVFTESRILSLLGENAV